MDSAFYDYPPYLYLLQVLKNCPEAGRTYMLAWRKRDKDNKVLVPKTSISSQYYTSPTKFSHHLLKLVDEGLANVDENKTFIVIEFVDWGIDAEGLTLC